MTTLDYSIERRLELTFEEGRREGRIQGIAEGKAQAIAEAKAQGITEGIAQGVELLSAAIIDLKAGKSRESLLDTGIPEDIIDKMIALFC